MADDRQLTHDRPAPNHAAPAELLALYRRAFADYGVRALWNIRQFDAPTVEEVLAITRQLRIEGDMSARRLAEQIEQAALADQ